MKVPATYVDRRTLKCVTPPAQLTANTSGASATIEHLGDDIRVVAHGEEDEHQLGRLGLDLIEDLLDRLPRLHTARVTHQHARVLGRGERSCDRLSVMVLLFEEMRHATLPQKKTDP